MLKVNVNAIFCTAGDFGFRDIGTVLDTDHCPYDCEITDYAYGHTLGSEKHTFTLEARGNQCLCVARDMLERLICRINSSRAYVLMDVAKMLQSSINQMIAANKKTPTTIVKSMSGNYEGTSVIIRITEDRTRMDIINEYNSIKDYTAMVETSHNCWGYANQARRDELLAEYRATLTPEAQLAIFLHDELCHEDHTSCCAWFYEIDGVTENWNGNAHRRYLDMAKRIMQETSDLEIAKRIIKAITNVPIKKSYDTPVVLRDGNVDNK